MSKKHFIPPLTYAERGNANPNDQYFYISTPKNENISFRIKKIGSVTDITGTVSRVDPQIISLDNGDGQLFVDSSQTNVVHKNKGYIIEADDVIYVSVRMNAGGPIGATSGPQAGALVSKGAAALGTTFRAGMYTNENPQTNYLNFISVMATQNNTNVLFSNLTAGILIKNSSNTGTSSISTTLNEGESYIIATNASDNEINKDGLIGTLIISNKDIVVNVGSANGSFGSGDGRDYGLDQIVDVSKVGTEYIFVRGNGNNDWEKILIVAHTNDTDIFVNGNSSPIATIDAGEYYPIDGNNYSSNNNMYIQTSEKVFAYQGIGGLNNSGNPAEANQGMFFVPPLSCENRKAVINIPKIDKIGGLVFTGGISIITNKTATVNINNLPIDNQPTTVNVNGPFNVSGNSEYVTYKLTGLNDNVIIESTDELYCAYFNSNTNASSGSFYSGFPSAPEVNFDTSISTVGNCIGNDLKLKAANDAIFDEFEWFFDDGTGFVTTTNTTTEIMPTLPGKYQLRAKIICNGTIVSSWKSIEIPVSICPDDYDKDGIIDNLDVDIDNDGILNCDESKGNATLDISTISAPVIIFNNNSTNTTTTGNISGSGNTFVGNVNGNFTSTVNTGTSSEGIYEINFNKNINFIFKQNTTETHTSNTDEFFILRVGPNNKNITLLDPDNQLLIDSNLDGDFESGNTQFSASEIKFKYAATLSGSTATFSFVANQVNQITFEHRSNSLTTPSVFNGNIKLTCFSLDSDNDSIEDMFDLDSDNDGIPDLYDAAGKTVTLTNTDTNSDGLDDIFDTITTNLDSDNDGIKNYLDIDSDNDGIFDSTEANHNLDTDFDGFVDNFTDSNNNGLADALENNLTIKTLSLKYIIANTDTDNLANFVELDSDNDDCFDVTEAGFTGNGSGILNATPFNINANGKVINNADGYTNPNNNYRIEAKIEVAKFNNATFCEGETNEIEITSNADAFQWQISTDNGANFSNITENSILSGATFRNVNSEKIEISNTPTDFNQYQFRVVLNKTGNSCGKISGAITLTVNPKPIILNNIVQLKQCADDASENTTVNLTEAEINISTDPNVIFTYYADENSAELGSPEVADKEKYPVNRTAEAWVRTTSELGCYTISKIEITASFAGNVAYNTTFEECDDLLDDTGNNSDGDGISNFDFSSAEQEIKNASTIPNDILVFFYETPEDRDAATNPILDISKHRNNNHPSYAFNQTIYIKIKNKNNNDCEGIGKLFLKVNQIPKFSVTGEAPEEPIIICLNNIPFTVEAENPAENYSYEWRDENNTILGNSITQEINKGGKYTVKASTIPSSANEKICSRERTITVVESNITPLDESFITIKDGASGNSDNLSVQIDIPKNPNSVEEYRYALTRENGVFVRNFQDSNIFDNINGGVYKIIAENKNSCGTSELLISVLQFPKFFTPNNDDKNDYWQIKGVNNTLYLNSNITIFNRYGNLIGQFPIDNRGWDGTFNGKTLPSGTYWYNIVLIPTDTSKPPIHKKGNFSLLRK
ncbi:T9SS type B sorting domain-containing protein [Polaribacter batillariae]|uniref:T9SS type B sorting domain-containing protein n=1 Tax=Polaribacter batillariae TaxID=2808900 RepID=A0ABX7SZE3_9FLAO|nr:T9SS type B sorting domain-containing protein [Polaribacter batillariae]QTD38174.1 T9SS type B sorting domain-containing protein [Polaribacter batillariae]